MCDLQNGKIKLNRAIENKIKMSKGRFIVRNNLNRKKNFEDLDFKLFKNKENIDYVISHKKNNNLKEITFNY